MSTTECQHFPPLRNAPRNPRTLSLVPALSTRVAHDNVNLAKRLLRLGEESVNLGDLADICLYADCLCAVVEVLDDLAHLVGGGFRCGIIDNDGAATLAQLDRTATADTTTSTRDESNLSLEASCWNGNSHCAVFSVKMLPHVNAKFVPRDNNSRLT